MENWLSHFIAVLLVIGAISVTAALNIWLESTMCSAKTSGIGESRYGVFSGCLVKPEGEDSFIPLENYRNVK